MSQRSAAASQTGDEKMANPRPEDKSTHAADDALRRTSEKAAEQTTRIGETTVESGQEAIRAGADLFERNAQTFQNVLRFGLDTTTAMMGRSADQFGRMFGLSGNEAQQATERSARNAAVVLQSSSAMAKVMSDMSREYLSFVRHQMETTMNRVNEVWTCRTPHDIAVVQSDLVRETVEGVVENNQRMADLSLKAAEAAKQATQNVARRAA